jgi:hypothetical protein
LVSYDLTSVERSVAVVANGKTKRRIVRCSPKCILKRIAESVGAESKRLKTQDGIVTYNQVEVVEFDILAP